MYTAFISNLIVFDRLRHSLLILIVTSLNFDYAYSQSKVPVNASNNQNKKIVSRGSVIDLGSGDLVNSENAYVGSGRLTPAEKDAVNNTMKLLPSFPKNSFSGCHARAHFDYIKLSNIIRGKLYKVWMLSSSLISPGFQGSIDFAIEEGISTSWDYHVALAFMDTEGKEWIIDRLISETPVLLSEWVNNFNINGFAVLARIKGENYLFTRTEVPAKDPIDYPNGLRQFFMAKNVFNSRFFSYTGDAQKRHLGASDIAIDALSEAFQEGEYSECEWVEYLSQSLILRSKIDEHPVPGNCESAKRLYETQFGLWIERGL